MTWSTNAVGQTLPDCGLWPDRGLHQGPGWTLLEVMKEPTSEDVPPCSQIQTHMRVAVNAVLNIPSHVHTASKCCSSQRGSVC